MTITRWLVYGYQGHERRDDVLGKAFSTAFNNVAECLFPGKRVEEQFDP